MVRCNIFEMKINYNMLNKSIDDYKRYNDKDNPNYIIMNSTTKYQMWKDCTPIENWNKKGISYAEYQGIPIAICDKLEDGVIDIV